MGKSGYQADQNINSVKAATMERNIVVIFVVWIGGLFLAFTVILVEGRKLFHHLCMGVFHGMINFSCKTFVYLCIFENSVLWLQGPVDTEHVVISWSFESVLNNMCSICTSARLVSNIQSFLEWMDG